jgi:hypothetical protein
MTHRAVIPNERTIMRFSLDVPVEKRSLKERDAVRLELEFPPSSGAAVADWQARAGGVLACLKPGRVPGPVRLTHIYMRSGQGGATSIT